MAKSVIIYGPPKCGKTTNKEALRKYFGLDKVVDEATSMTVTKREGVLYLTNDKLALYQAGCLHYKTAMKMLARK